MRSFLETWQRPDAAMLGIVGDFNSAAMAQLLQEAFGTWAPAPGQPAAPLPTPSTPLPSQEGVAGQVYLVDKPGATQVGVGCTVIVVAMLC